ncbi:hypothetical protein [Dyella japonica]|uniref:Uncharacterized protein n=1 Tax=Dyella japonica TaxID=231455 RepID=A0ABV2JUA7_9GAMM
MAAGYPAGRRFSTSNGPVGSVLVPVMIIGLLGDFPLSWVLITLCRPAHPGLIHGAVFGAGLFAVGWALAVRSVSSAIPHVIDERTLWLGGGTRYEGSISRALIHSVHTFQESRYAWAAANQLHLSDVLIVSRPDSPNVAIELEDSAMNQVRLSRKGKVIAPRRWILLYADRPKDLAAALSSKALAAA